MASKKGKLRVKDEDLVKLSVEIQNIRRYKHNWCLCDGFVTKCKQGNVKEGTNIKLKGILEKDIKEGCSYNVMLEEDNDPQWGMQYIILAIFPGVKFNENDIVSQKKFLSFIFTEYQVFQLYEALDDPFKVLKEHDEESLIKVKGCGLKSINSWFKKFDSNINKCRIFTELEDYNLTNSMINKLLGRYYDPENVIKKVKENPYILCRDVDGIGWKTADKIALQGGIDKYGIERVSTYMNYYLNTQANQGRSWVTPDELMGAILEELGDDTPDQAIVNALYHLHDEDIVCWNEDKSKIGIKYIYDLEQDIAQELIRIRDAKSRITVPDNWMDSIKHLEHVQGWQFTQEQLDGIKMGLDNNIVVITGGAGVGKTSIVSGILKVLKNYSFSQCALAGKAAARMAEVTGKEGFTIHRLLGWGAGEVEKRKRGFAFHEDCPLPDDIYIMDEISMVDLNLFRCFLKAVPDGAKIFMLGDPNQLESIGSGNIAHDLITSPEIKTAKLTKIHRQASKSAIITESMAINKGEMIVDKDWAGKEIRGELEDLFIWGYSDASNTFYNIMERFNYYMNQPDFDIMKTQVIVPIKTKGTSCTYELNNAIQELYNPKTNDMVEVTVYGDKAYYLREGDKVINRSNNYEVKPNIFNGNVGKIISIDEENNKMTIDFLNIGTVILEYSFWGNIELAYATTCHSNQGSEYDIVIYGVDFSSYALLTREQIYTGITRAKKKCELICQTNALRYAISHQGISKKQTYLKDCLYEVAHPKLLF